MHWSKNQGVRIFVLQLLQFFFGPMNLQGFGGKMPHFSKRFGKELDWANWAGGQKFVCTT